MQKVIDKLYTQIDLMNPISKKVIKYGFFFFLLVIILCVLAVALNKYLFDYNYLISEKSVEVFRSSFSILGITLIGGLLMDYISKRS